ncbi:cytochrome ubiquinol oxidase subunit I [Granulicoccus sp. GXG6511]|uniref:cytochrome ubiquinol oxidase subunit I n=1 Tax=Granulicoccus sp. GXG6511 TaxID=3381351 RepID=UPI003D7E0204
MSSETIARWQFGITTVYHFLFVPITLGLSWLVAVLQTLWVRTGNQNYLRLTKFYGKLFLINFAMGLVTGLVQEFQFGMNWSEYSRFVGDIFGAPLALEALLAFFLESTFLGLWIFGWDRLNKYVHLACIWIVALGTMLSAMFILAANSFMQNPVGFRFNPETNRAELTDFLAVLTNKVFLATFPHQMAAAFLVAAAFLAAVAGWHLHRLNKTLPRTPDSLNDVDGMQALADHDHEVAPFRFTAKLGAVLLIIAGLAVMQTGDFQGKAMYEKQPMKMAAAEGAFESTTDFSILTIGNREADEEIFAIHLPGLLSFLSYGNFTEPVPGIRPLEARYQQEFTPLLRERYGDEVADWFVQNGYHPNIVVTYWTFRAMITLGLIATAIGAWMLWVLRGDRLPRGRLWPWLMIALPLAPLFGNSFGWIFTEMGRQPWVVFGLMPTQAGVSPGVTPGQMLFSLIGYTVIYAVLAVIEVKLMLYYIRKGLDHYIEEPKVLEDDDAPLTFAY